MDDPPEVLSTTATPRTGKRIAAIGALLEHVKPGKIGLFVASLALFILAITLMKEGALSFSPLIQDQFAITNPLDSLGFGWLFAYLIMSGSPVAAAALTFFNAGILNSLNTFSMITGSRLGASFIVLFIGFIYVIRGRDRATSLGMGLLSLSVTGTTHLVGLFLGLAMLNAGWFGGLQTDFDGRFTSLTGLVFDPITGTLMSFIPRWGLFLVGMGIIVVSFNMFDRCLPQMTIRESSIGHVSRMVYRPWVMFLLGAGVTLMSMSVSISLSILVPLSNRGFVRRENIVPYILGANITTFVDTLLAAVLLGNPEAFSIVLIEMISIAIVSMFILIFVYRPYQHAMLDVTGWVTRKNRNMVISMMIIFVIPIGLMFF